MHLKVENLSNFDKEVVEKKLRKIDLPIGEKAYNCIDCNTTCDYPCDESHMSLERCKLCIPTAEGPCKKCQGRCHYTKHSRVEYRLEVELVTTTVTNDAMKAEHAAAVAEFQSHTVAYNSMRNDWEKDFERLLKGNELIENMQKSIQEQDDILSVRKGNEVWDNYGDILEQLTERRTFVEECHGRLKNWDLL